MSEIICSTCLSLNRKLFTLDRNKYLESIFRDHTVMENIHSVCWECLSMFKKIHKFKLQILRAQNFWKCTSQKISLSPLSHLTCSIINFNDICCNKNIENLNQNENPHRQRVLDTELIQKIKSEDTNASNKDVKSDASFDMHVDIDTIIHENYSDILNNEVDEGELNVPSYKKTNVTRKTKTDFNVRKKKNNIDRETKKQVVLKRKSKILIAKENYIVTKMTEEEMRAKRETDRQADRYKNKVKYRCELCIVGFFHKKLYENHMKTRHSEKSGVHQCSICEITFSRANYYQLHLDSHYRKCTCKLCGYTGYKLSEMVSHDAKEHGVRRFICKLCREEFPSPSSLRFHHESQHLAPPKCESCSKLFTTRNGLRVHIQQMHSYKPKTTCTVCGARVRYMQSHMRKHCAVPEATYCTECDQRFTSTAAYKSHLKYTARHRVSDTVLRYKCSVCDSKFVNSTGLKKHTLAVHSNEHPFECDRCGKGFRAHYKLRLHIKHAHEGVEKPKDNICQICGRGFSTKFTLSNHIRVHTGEKPFRCELCAAAFSQKSSLTTHMRGVHLKIKPRPGRHR